MMAMPTKGLKIYVAGPYTADHPREIQKNVDKAIDIGLELIRKGHNPFIPHLTHYIDLRSHCDLSWEDYMRLDKAWLESCDAFFFISHSKGASLELEHAKTLGLKIFTSIEDVPYAD